MFKVISGGQTGADRAGLDVAKKLGITTGGYAPKDYWTTDGAAPELKDYGLQELQISGADGYRTRTTMNVNESTLTIAIASDLNSPGERLTRSTCAKLKKPYFSVHFNREDDIEQWLNSEETLNQLKPILDFLDRRFLLGEDVVLNVAGNSARTSPRSYQFATAVCELIFNYVITSTTADVKPSINIYD